MDDFSIYGDSFDQCLHHLELVLAKMQEKESNSKLREMSLHGGQGIVLGHKISGRGIEVDNAKIEVIAKLPPPKSIKDIRSFLGHVGFYDCSLRILEKLLGS